MRVLVSVFIFSTMSVVLLAEEKSVTGLMHKFLGYMQALKPYISSEQKMNDPKNDSEIRGYLKGLSETVKTAKHEPKFRKPTLKISREALESHIYETERVFKVGNKNYTRWMLQSTLSVCMSCHTQIPSTSKNFDSFIYDKQAAPFDQAEFLFATRQFDKAHEYYDKAVKSYPENKMAPFKVEDALERQVAYFSRIKRDPSAGRDYLKNLLKQNKKLPGYVVKDVEAWTALFHEWSQEKTPDMKTISEADLKKYVENALKSGLWDKLVEANNPRVMSYLKVSGLLYEYLEYHPETKLIPEILYWLAKYDRVLNNNFFYSLADMYLRECVVSYPTHPIAPKCYQDYEDSITVGYMGSSGIHIPEDVSNDLKKIKTQMEKARESLKEKK